MELQQDKISIKFESRAKKLVKWAPGHAYPSLDVLIFSVNW